MALRIKGLFGRCAEVASESEVLRVGARMGLTSTSSLHGVDLTAFSGSTPKPWP